MKKRTLKPERVQYVILMIACLIVWAIFLPSMVIPLIMVWYVFFWNICEEEK